MEDNTEQTNSPPDSICKHKSSGWLGGELVFRHHVAVDGGVGSGAEKKARSA